MSSFAEQPARPSMRRKSSAQNLLTSLKSASSSSASSTMVQTASITSSNTYVPSTPPIPSTPIVRDWDSQSLHAESINSNSANQGTSVEYLRDLVQKRITTLTYIRSMHEGGSHWFHTIMVSRAELDRVFTNNEMRKRTPRFATLGMSLSNLMDIQQPQDLLRGLINVLSEYDQSKEDGDKSRVRQARRVFKGRVPKKLGAFPEYSTVDSYGEASFLVTPHIPFALDYHQTLLSLLDVLSEVYHRISKLLGPSPFSHTVHMAGPLGLLAPQPGVSYLFPDGGQDSSLYHIAYAGINGSSQQSNGVFGGNLASPPPSWTPGFGEMVLKIDGKFKKLISGFLKELDQFARNSVKDELASLDPLLRNINAPEKGLVYDLEGM